MKTKNLFTVILLMLAIGFSSCREKDIPPHPDCGVFNLTATQFVSWCVFPNVVSENSEIVENRTNKKLVFHPTALSLEYFNGNDWEAVDFNPRTSLHIRQPIKLASGEMIDDDTFLRWRIESSDISKKGKYRIVRYFHLQSDVDFNPETDIEFPLYAEFIIE